MPVTPELEREVGALPTSPDEDPERSRQIVGRIVRSIALFVRRGQLDVLRELDHATEGVFDFAPRSSHVPIATEASIGEARREAANLAVKMGFGAVARTKVATAASELARNIFAYAGRGHIRMRIDPTGQRLTLEASDEGPGIADVDAILEGRYRSRSGLGMGLRGVKSIAKRFRIDTGSGGTTVRAEFEP